MSSPQRLPARITPEQLSRLEQQYRTCIASIREKGLNTKEGQELAKKAQAIKQLITQYSGNTSAPASAAAASRTSSMPGTPVPLTSTARTNSQQVIQSLLTTEENATLTRLTDSFRTAQMRLRMSVEQFKKQLASYEQDLSKPNNSQAEIEELSKKKTEIKLKITTLDSQIAESSSKFIQDQRILLQNFSKTNMNLKRFLQQSAQTPQRAQSPVKIETPVSTPQPMARQPSEARPIAVPSAYRRPVGYTGAYKLPPYEVDSKRVLSKRKLKELVRSVGADEGDEETHIDGDVEEILLDLADEFITSVTEFTCRLTKHRKSNTLDARDILLNLEKNWNIRIPGYGGEEVKTIRKWQPSLGYTQKLQSVVDKTTE